MANSHHVALVWDGTEAIDRWRHKNPGVRLDLSNADLSEIIVIGADLSEATLTGARLDRAKLFDLNLNGANLARASLTWADIAEVDLEDAILAQADLSGADIYMTNLMGADLSQVDLCLARTTECFLNGTNLSKAVIGETNFSSIDFSNVIGLTTVIHEGPSYIDVSTLIDSLQGSGDILLPDLRTFFQGAGVPLRLLEEMPRLISQVEYCSCFISYGEPDKAFAERLTEDLRARGVSAWIYSLDSTPGERTWREISQQRRGAAKMVLLCSCKALIRDGALKEIEEQIDEDPDKIIAISLDDDWKQPGFRVMRGNCDLKPYLFHKNYADFANLPYSTALERLLKGLRRKR